MRNYLLNLQAGLFEIDRTVCPNGVVCIVVQDSYYKNFKVDLQRIVSEMVESRGRVMTRRYDYSAHNPRSHARHISGTGPASNRHNTETLLVFG